LIPGCGFGGSCFPKDVQAIRSLGRDHGLAMNIMSAVLETNEKQPHQVIKILEAETGSLINKKVLILGLAFKPGTDDVRESSAIQIIFDFLKSGAKVYAHDPIAVENFLEMYDDKVSNDIFIQDWRAIIKEVDHIIIVTAWEEYLELNKINLTGKIIFDTRRLLDSTSMNPKKYLSIGRNI